MDAVLDRFHNAAAESDFVSYREQMTDDIVFLGTDATERWQGDTFFDFARPYFEQGRGWTYIPRERRIDIAPSGDVAWFDELLDNQKLGLCRSSGLLLRTTDGWKIAQYNLSMPVPNAMAERVAREIQGEPPAAAPVTPAPVEAATADEEMEPEPVEDEPQKRCRKRHKTNTRADC
ncbi:nuclear transport factor 2 family protein [Parahaliea maris]|uniref:nuclear transport factor 2 family protein n=1 Tax=Parahaliea maris TaxID=2716870 RepID=UPI0016509393|nr:nuclear transport factor 2 family protein [Parahaliea maris]